MKMKNTIAPYNLRQNKLKSEKIDQNLTRLEDLISTFA